MLGLLQYLDAILPASTSPRALGNMEPTRGQRSQSQVKGEATVDTDEIHLVPHPESHSGRVASDGSNREASRQHSSPEMTASAPQLAPVIDLLQQVLRNQAQGAEEIRELSHQSGHAALRHYQTQTLINRVSQLQGKVFDAGNDKERMESELRELRSKHQLLTDAHKEICRELATARKERDGFQRQLLQQSATRSASSNKTADSEVQASWKRLSYNIRSLAYFLAGWETVEDLDVVVAKRMSGVTRAYKSYLDDKDYQEFLLQAYLWRAVEAEVFNGQGCVMGGDSAILLKKIRKDAIETAQKKPSSLGSVCGWVAQGTALLENLWGVNKEALESLVKAETRRLRPFGRAQGIDDSEFRSRVSGELKAIFETALDLDTMFMRSKAGFVMDGGLNVDKLDHNYRFCEGQMESVAQEGDLTDQSSVRMVISPMLTKYGTADGRDYDSRMVLIKASVVCD